MSYTRIPNDFIDNLKLNPYQFQILSIIVRKTDGWCKVEDGISLSQFEKLVTFSKNTIIKTIKELQELSLIEVASHFDSVKKTHSYNTYKVSQGVVQEMNKGSAGDEQGVVQEMNKGSAGDEQGVVQEMNKQKKTITKETNTNIKKNIKKVTNPKNKKEQLINILKEKDLTNINKKSLNEWLEYKEWNYKEIGINKIIGLLKQYSFSEQEEIINKSIISNYKGLFALNKNTSDNQPQKQYQTRAEKTKAFIEDYYKRREAEANQNNSTDIVDAEVLS